MPTRHRIHTHMIHRIRHRSAFALFVSFLLLCGIAPSARAAGDSTLTVLVVTAHPDDESGFAATVYKITHDLHGKVDLALITNGEGGYKYSTLAESVYGVELTDESVGRQYLPAIRKKELMAGGAIIGIRNYFFMDQKDNRYMLDASEVLDSIWNVPQVKERLAEIMTRGHYDYVFTLLPTEGTHGHHKAATILALQTVKGLPGDKPVVLGVSDTEKSDTTSETFFGLKNYPVTSISSGKPSFFFDRTSKFGYHDALDYKVIVNWLIAEHKSQGSMQTGMNRGDVENFWYYDINDPAKMKSTAELFERLKVNTFKTREYN